MTIQLKLLAGLFIILTVLASYFSTYKYGRHVEYLKQDNLRKEAIIKANAENEVTKLELQKVRQNAEIALNTLLDTPAPRLRPICPSGQVDPADRGVLPAAVAKRTDLGSQEVLDRLTGRIDAKAAEWSRALSACAVVMEWAKKR